MPARWPDLLPQADCIRRRFISGHGTQRTRRQPKEWAALARTAAHECFMSTGYEAVQAAKAEATGTRVDMIVAHGARRSTCMLQVRVGR